jgi:hypothetical protein
VKMQSQRPREGLGKGVPRLQSVTRRVVRTNGTGESFGLTGLTPTRHRSLSDEGILWGWTALRTSLKPRLDALSGAAQDGQDGEHVAGQGAGLATRAGHHGRLPKNPAVFAESSRRRIADGSWLVPFACNGRRSRAPARAPVVLRVGASAIMGVP